MTSEAKRQTAPKRCAALDWDKKQKDYIECDDSEPKTVRLKGIVTVEEELCDVHRDLFEREFAAYGGLLDKVKRVTVLAGRTR